MIGLEYILNLYNMQHSELADLLGIRKQNINLWVKGKQKISQKHLPRLKDIFKLDKEFFQKELTDIDKLIIQKNKIQQELRPAVIEYNPKFDVEEKMDLIEVPIYDVKEMNEINFTLEKTNLLEKFKKVLFEIEEDTDLDLYSELIKLLEGFGRDCTFKYVIDGLSHYYGVLPDWVGTGDPKADEFMVKLTQLFYEYDEEE